MTNGEWLDYLARNAPDEPAAWFDAEHVEHQERALDGDTAPENEDSREQLEVDIRKYANPEGNTGTLGACWERKMLEFIDRQAAITEQEVEHDLMKAGRMAVEVERERIKKLTAERDELKGQVFTLKGECEDLENERDKLQEQLRIGWECECRLQTERERYREKFGKCLDYADAIHALMDEGMA